MTQDPTAYDLLQDSRIEGIEEVVHPYYTPPGDVEYSFPVVGQGITADQYRLMSLTQGDGIIHRGVRPYYLEGHPTDAETNTRNTLILKVDGQTGYSESIIGGFYHRLNQDMEISFPPVTTPTDYHVCVTYDPRKEDEETGPVSIETYAGEPPRTQGRMHIILNVVRREPNQLLSQATIQRYRQFVSPTIAIQNAGQLPDPSDVLFGTTAFAGKSGSDTFDLYRNTSGGWKNMLVGPWEDVFQGNRNMWTVATGTLAPRARLIPMGVQLKGIIYRNTATLDTFALIHNSRFWPARRIRLSMATSGEEAKTLIIETNGDMTVTGGWRGSHLSLEGIIYPLD